MSESNEAIDTYNYFRDEVYPKLRTRQALHQALYWCNYETGFEKDTELFRKAFYLPTGRMMIENPVNHIAMDKMDIHISPLLSGPKGIETKGAQELSDKKERWAQALLDEWGLVQPYLLREVVKNELQFGEVFIKVWVEQDALVDPEAIEGNPFKFHVPPASSVMASLDMEDGLLPLELFEEKVLTARQVRKLASELNKGEDYSKLLGSVLDAQLVSLVEWWTPKLHGYFTGERLSKGRQVIPINGEDAATNIYGVTPYVRGFSGYGVWPEDGDPSSLAVGILTGWEKSIIELTRLATIIDTWAAKFALPPALITYPGEVPAAPPMLELGPSTQIDLPKGATISYLLSPPLPDVIVKQYELLLRQFEAFMPGITTGQGQSGEAAISAVTRLNQAGLLWEPIYITAKKVIAKAIGLCMMMLEKNIQTSVELRGLKLGVKDIQGHYAVEVESKPGNPETQNMRLLMMKSLQGLLARRTLLERFGGIEDATQEMLAQDADAILRSELIMRQAGLDALAELGMEKELAQAQGAVGTQAVSFTGKPPPSGMPTIPTMGENVPGIGGSPTRGGPPLAAAQTVEEPGIEAMRRMEEAGA